MIAVLLVLWHFAVARQPAHLLPTPFAVAAGIVELARSGLLLKYVVASLFRLHSESKGNRRLLSMVVAPSHVLNG